MLWRVLRAKLQKCDSYLRSAWIMQAIPQELRLLQSPSRTTCGRNNSSTVTSLKENSGEKLRALSTGYRLAALSSSATARPGEMGAGGLARLRPQKVHKSRCASCATLRGPTFIILLKRAVGSQTKSSVQITHLTSARLLPVFEARLWALRRAAFRAAVHLVFSGFSLSDVDGRPEAEGERASFLNLLKSPQQLCRIS